MSSFKYWAWFMIEWMRKLQMKFSCSVNLRYKFSIKICFKYFKYPSDRTGPLNCVFNACLEPALIGDEQMFQSLITLIKFQYKVRKWPRAPQTAILNILIRDKPIHKISQYLKLPRANKKSIGLENIRRMAFRFSNKLIFLP